MDALFRTGFSSVKHYFALFPKKPAWEIIFRGPIRILTPVAFRVYDEDRDGGTCATVTRKIDPCEFLHQRIRYPAQWERALELSGCGAGKAPAGRTQGAA